jgi:hypothetical protein
MIETTLPIRYEKISGDKPPKLLCFGAGGHTLHLTHSHYAFGYHSIGDYFQPSKWWAHEHREVANPRDYEGVPWRDMSFMAHTSAAIDLSFNGPLVNVDLKCGELQDFGGIGDRPILRTDQSKTFEDRVRHIIETYQGNRPFKRPGPLDQVSTEEYAAQWKMAGGKVGTVQAGCFVEMDDDPDISIPMRHIKVWFEDGDFIETNINGTRREVFDYYVGTRFNVASGRQTAMSVEFIAP